jgi:predicted nucleic acid-binding protein
MKPAPPLVDTNFLVYLFDANEPAKRKVARGIVEGCFSGRDSLAVSVQNLAEFAVVMTEKVEHPVPREIVSRFIRDIAAFSQWRVIKYDGRCIEDAIAIGGETGLHFWDALLVATMKAHGITMIYTEDAHFVNIPFIRAVNPFS